ncbi:MAG: LamG domain-containing protein [Candidatus Kariarchaeaceae archaeon]|jgi:hypothetical protein
MLVKNTTIKSGILILTLLFLVNVSVGKQVLSANELVLSLPMDENSGTTALDQSSKGNDGKIFGASWTTGIMGSALEFDGDNDYLEINNTDILETVNALTISAWVIGSSDPSLKYFIGAYGFGIWQRDNEMGLAISTPLTESARGIVLLNHWTFITGTYDGYDIKFYVNGILQDTYNHPGTMSTGVRNVTIGLFGTSFWAGTIDEVNIWNKVLSPSEIENQYQVARRFTVTKTETKTVPGTSIITSAKSDAGLSYLSISVIFALMTTVTTGKYIKRRRMS